MQKDDKIRAQKANNALGIVSVEGKKPSKAALDISKRYIAGEISSAQAKQLYLKENRLAP